MNWHVLITSSPPTIRGIDPDDILEFFHDQGPLEVVLGRARVWVIDYDRRRKPEWPAVRYVGVYPE